MEVYAFLDMISGGQLISLLIVLRNGVFPNYVCQIRYEILRVLEAPLADIEPLNFSTDELFGVKRRIPGIEKNISKDNFADVEIDGLFTIALRSQWGS